MPAASRVLMRVLGPGLGAIAFAVVAVGLYLAANVRGPGASTSAIAGCESADAQAFVESREFTPFEDQITHVPDFPINPDGAPIAAAAGSGPTMLDGMSLAWAGAARGANAEAFYFDGVIGSKMTRPQFYAAGGISVLTSPYDPLAGDYVANLQMELGDRVVLVEVGAFDGALTWWDPLSNGVRPHQLSWVSDGLVHSLIGERAPEALVNLARGTVC